MWLTTAPPLTDPAAVRFRMATVKAGIWLGMAMVAAGLAYFALTWDAGNRPLLATLGVAIAVSDLGLLLLPMQRIVTGHFRELFFLGWTLSTVAVLLVLGALDPNEPSPLTLPLMMPMLFAGMSYPRASARIACAAAVLGYGAEILLLGQVSAFSAFYLMVLVWTAGMCLWMARNREHERDELKRQRDELERVSITDPLTAALNRRGFEDRLSGELADAARSESPLTLAIVDLDNFKAVNDRDGHDAGDALLCETVRCLSAVLRPLDALGRVGGDEFAVLLPGLGETNADLVVDRLYDALAGGVPASIGYSCFPADGICPEELFKQADLRLYTAKGNG